MRRWMFGLNILLTIAILFIVLSGCHTAPQKPTLRIGYLPITHAALPLIVYSQNEGKFKNFNLEMVRFSSWPEMAEAIEAGKIDGGGSILTSLAIKIASQGVAIKSVLMAVRDGSVLVVHNDIATVADLKGRTIAIPSKFSAHYIALAEYLEKNGLKIDLDVKTIDMAPPDMVQAFAAKAIDGYIVAEPFGIQAEELKLGKILLHSKDSGLLYLRSNECIIAIRDDFIDKNPDAVQEFVDAIIQAGIWVEENPEKAGALLKPYLGLDGEVIARSFNDPYGRTRFVDLFPYEEEYVDFQDRMVQYGLLERKIDINDFVDERFAQKSYEKYNLHKMDW